MLEINVVKITICPPGYAWGYNGGASTVVEELRDDKVNVAEPLSVDTFFRTHGNRKGRHLENVMALAAHGRIRDANCEGFF